MWGQSWYLLTSQDWGSRFTIQRLREATGQGRPAAWHERELNGSPNSPEAVTGETTGQERVGDRPHRRGSRGLGGRMGFVSCNPSHSTFPSIASMPLGWVSFLPLKPCSLPHNTPKHLLFMLNWSTGTPSQTLALCACPSLFPLGSGL